MKTQEKKRIHCQACGKVIAEINGQSISFMTFKQGKPMTTKISLRYDTGGQFKLTCGCGGSTFSRVMKTLPMTYAIAKHREVS